MFLRFVVTERHTRSDREMGIFSALYDLEDRGELRAGEIEWFRESERWLNKHLRRPSRLAWSSRPNAPERAISWFRDTAIEHVSRVRALCDLLEHKGIAVTELRTEKPGYVVYQDEYQVVAMPFASETFKSSARGS
jgi:predicted deacetylase